MSLDWTELVKALGLVMVIEGLLPFAVPTQWRRMLGIRCPSCRAGTCG